jgi:hypothetical protein
MTSAARLVMMLIKTLAILAGLLSMNYSLSLP